MFYAKDVERRKGNVRIHPYCKKGRERDDTRKKNSRSASSFERGGKKKIRKKVVANKTCLPFASAVYLTSLSVLLFSITNPTSSAALITSSNLSRDPPKEPQLPQDSTREREREEERER
jgi:hypothetical protein